MVNNSGEHRGNKWLPITFLVLSIVGLSDATYLTIEHYKSLSVGCLAGNDCDRVLASVYSTIGNIPVALLGFFYYLVIFASITAYFYFKQKNQPASEQILDFAVRFTLIGFIASLWFVYLQLFVIHAICAYCMISAITSTTLFVLGLIQLYRQSHSELAGEKG